MIGQRERELVALGGIVIAALAAGSMFLTSPLDAKLQSRKSMLDELRMTIRDAPSEPEIMQRDKAASELRSWILEAGAPAGDESALYRRITSIASELGVRIDRLDPSRVAGTSSESKAFQSYLSYSIQAIGTYESIARFLESIRTEFGFSAAVGFTIRPAANEDGELVRASIDTVHLRFDPNALEAVAQADELEVEE